MRLGVDFSLGGEQAEADPLLQQAFFESGHFSAIDSKDDPRCFIVGRTGSGKSALLQRIEEQHSEHVIRINPEDLSLPYIADLGVVNYLASLDVHLDPFFIALWKHVMLIEIIKHRYKVDSPAAKQNFLASLRDKISRDRSKMAALEYLEEFEGKFWCETDERVKDITNRFEEQIENEAGGKITIPATGELVGKIASRGIAGQETTRQLVERFQRVVNETQLPRLNKMMTVLNDEILDSPQHYTYMVIDDLDRDWVDEKVLNSLIRCLFRTVVDLKRIRNLKVLVALRTNIFEQLNFGARTGGQEEKFRSLTLHVRWVRNDLEHLLDTRARVAAEHHGIEGVRGISNMLPASNREYGNPISFILRHTLMRPRDALAFLNECLSLAAGKRRITWAEIKGARRPYSRNRLLALRDEWKPSYPDIDRFFGLFQSSPTDISREGLMEMLDDAALLPADSEFLGVRWMTELSAPVWNGLDGDDWITQYQPMIEFLFHIGFLGCITTEGSAIYSHDQPEFVGQASNLAKIDVFCVHPAFRAALDVLPASD
jgi:hypothetical protein